MDRRPSKLFTKIKKSKPYNKKWYSPRSYWLTKGEIIKRIEKLNSKEHLKEMLDKSQIEYNKILNY